MWQLDWASVPPIEATPPTNRSNHDPNDHDQVAFVGGLMWEEHCHECSEPDCYRTCPLFVRRTDGRCARLEYGIFPNPAFAGVLPYGADVKFRRWGKLESVIPVRRVPLGAVDRLSRLDGLISKATQWVDKRRKWPMRYQITAAYRSMRIRTLRNRQSTDFDKFLLECWSPEEESFKLVIECKNDGRPFFRHSIAVNPGWNYLSLPAIDLLSGAVDRSARMLVYPENDATVRVIFTCLDFVTYKSQSSQVSPDALAENSGSLAAKPKVKCVVWDLDNTLWNGILADVGSDGVFVDPSVRHVVEALDHRGILQSISSKNDHDAAWEAITKFGLENMFLSPAISWSPKSAGIRSIARTLNIGTDTFAFIDDSSVERAEVSTQLPEVLVLDESEIGALLGRDEFDVRPTGEGSRRRLSYLAEGERQLALDSSPQVELDEFLKACELRVDLSIPRDLASIERCHELMMRSNQLNLTTRRYSRSELEVMLKDATRVSLAVRVRDKYGDYGLVGFVSMCSSMDESIIVSDLVFSCRVAKKYVENAVVEAIRLSVSGRSSTIDMMFVPTERNGALLEALHTMGPSITSSDERSKSVRLRFATDRAVPFADIASEIRVDPAVSARIRAISGGPLDRVG